MGEFQIFNFHISRVLTLKLNFQSLPDFDGRRQYMGNVARDPRGYARSPLGQGLSPGSRGGISDFCWVLTLKLNFQSLPDFDGRRQYMGNVARDPRG